MATPLEELGRRLSALLPADAEQLRDDVTRNVRALVASALERMDVVTREEFDVQAALLARTRERLEALEARVAALEAALEEQRGEG